ncbi:MAG: aminotransferase class I/II-fold pyridoxal phosphate-dependent enzyme [Chlamydiota bacterium]
MRIADRMRQIDSSGIRNAFDLAQKMENPVNLSIGQPDFDVPDALKEAAIRAIRAGHHRYTLTQGIDELRAEIRRHLEEEKGYSPEEVMVTSGAAGGIMLAFLVLLNPGDRAVIPDPYFVIYKHLCRLVGAEPVFLDTYPDFTVTPERLERAIGKGAALVILNSPSNPTGMILHGDRLREIAAIAARTGAHILSDEVYDFFAYDRPHESMGAFSPDALIVGGYSKSFGMPGWRVGYAAGPREILREMIKIQQYSFICAPSVLQHGVIGAYRVDMRATIDAYRKKRDMVCGGLQGKYRFIRPEGAFYLFPEAPGGSGAAFVHAAVGRKLILVPGSVFSERDTHFRLSFAAPDETLRRGVEILNELA